MLMDGCKKPLPLVRPMCFTDDAWKLVTAEPFASKLNTYCWDCDREYQEKRIADGTCGFPGVQFIESGEGDVNGFRNYLVVL